MQTLLMTIALILACTAAAWFDVRERRIPNALTLGALAVAIIIRATAGIEVVGAGLLGALVGFGVALPFFLVGGLGGGDLKLIAAIGAFLGPGRLFFALLITALVGGVMAVTTIIRRKAGLETAANLHTLIASFGLRNFTGWRKDSEVPLTIHSPAVITVPYGVAISAGALAAWFVYTTNPGWSFVEVLTR